MTSGDRPAKRLAAVQSNYVPWKGYFDLINSVDEFVLLDDVQYTRRDWRNRNRIKTPSGVVWLTVPVQVKGRYEQRIDEVVVRDDSWRERHWQTLAHNYARAVGFEELRPVLEPLYQDSGERRLSLINRSFIDAVCGFLGITTRISWSSDYATHGVKTTRIASLCAEAGVTEYVSGPTARGYLDEALLAEAGVAVSYIDYAGYPEYPQLHPPFEHAVSILDLLLNVGSDAPRYMHSFDLAAANA